MPLFHYLAFNETGEKMSGIIDAHDLNQAKEKLRDRSIIVTKIAFIKNPGSVCLDAQGVIHFTKEMAFLLRAGVPLYESLVTIEEKNRSRRCHALFLNLCDQIKQGKSLSYALSLYPASFNSIYVAMIISGENTGDLESTFTQLHKVFSRNAALKKQIQFAIAYPAFLAGFCLFVLIGLFFFLIPSLQELFEGRNLHTMTRCVLFISAWLRKYGLVGGICGSIFAVASCFLYRMKNVKNLCKKIFLKMPFFRTLYVENIFLRFSRILSILFLNGVPIIEALQLSKDVVDHPTFCDSIDKIEEGIISGGRLSHEMKKSRLFPSLMIRMVATSEEAGNSGEMLGHIADIYEEQLEKSLRYFISFLQPVLLLFLGLIVGAVLLSVLLPLTDVSSFV